MNPARLLMPMLRFPLDGRAFEEALSLAESGVAGFCVFTADAMLAETIARLRAAAPHPILFASDLEHGAGQQLPGCTNHPPAAALSVSAARAAGGLTALEALPRGIGMTFAPVCDVVSSSDNPIIQSRAFSDALAAPAAFVAGARGLGLRTCAKHFPGHGATTEDSHSGLPRVDASRELWEQRDLPPFRACFEAGVDAVMTAHIACPGLSGDETLPATLSRRVMTGLLRDEMGFDGLCVSDALLMEGVLQGRTEAQAAVAALDAGCDLLICPEDPVAVLRGLEEAPEERVTAALERVARTMAPLELTAKADPRACLAALTAAAERSVEARGEFPLRPGERPVAVCDLHGDGETIATRLGLHAEVLAPDGSVKQVLPGPGLDRNVLVVARRDKAWGAPSVLPDPIRRRAEDAALVVALGTPALLEGVSPPARIWAPGEDPFTLTAIRRKVLGA